MSSPAQNRDADTEWFVNAVLDALAQVHMLATVAPPSDSLADCKARLAHMRLLELAIEPAGQPLN